MKKLERIHLIQFYLYDAVELEINGATTFLGANGSGKTSMLDAIQIAMMGAHGGYLQFNSQAHLGGKQKRSIRDYCLGLVQENEGGKVSRRRDTAHTYISLTFRDEATGLPLTLGTHIVAAATGEAHDVAGLYVAPGVALDKADHLEAVDGGLTPKRWADFKLMLQARCAEAGTREGLVVTDRPETYVREMLHQLQPATKAIEAREFLRAFSKSTVLRDIENVSDFVRDYIVEPAPIDRQRARRQIDLFKQLQALLAKVKKQVEDLSGIETLYDKVAHAQRRHAAALAVKAALVSEEKNDLWTGKSSEIEQLREEIIEGDEQLATLAPELAEARKALDDAKAALHSSPTAHTLELKRDLQANLEQSSQEALVAALGYSAKVLTALRSAVTAGLPLQDLLSRVDTARQALGQGRVEGWESLLDDCAHALEQAAGQVERQRVDRQRRLAEAQARLTDLQDEARHAETGGAPLEPNVRSLMRLLQEAGIEAEPACLHVRVTDPEWQPAIEGVLGASAQYLLVPPGREAEAIEVFRRMPAAYRRGNGIINNNQVREVPAVAGRASALLDGDHEVAVAFLRAKLQAYQCVETSADLARHHNALSKDGMRTASGSTTSLDLQPAARFRLGQRYTPDRLKDLQEQLTSAQGVVDSLEAKMRESDQVLAALRKVSDMAELSAGMSQALAAAQAKRHEAQAIAESLALLDSGELSALRDAVAEKESHAAAQQAAEREAALRVERLRARLQAAEEQLPQLAAERDAARAEEERCRAHPDFDQEVADRLFPALGDLDVPLAVKTQDCDSRIRREQGNAATADREANAVFQRYLDHQAIVLGDDAREWRSALAWVQAEKQRLVETELLDYQHQVVEAGAKAEDAFRSDIALRLRENILRMKDTLESLNRVLKAGPAFSNGERYAFEHVPATAYEPLYKYIMSAGDAAPGDLFESADFADLDLLTLLDMEEGTSPVDDYRRLFVFDLLILQDGKVATRLSKRIGTGSNGEHRTPFYVVAGAALAAAYRLDNKDHTGAAIMLLDEAFYAVDAQNSLAIGRFLDSMGLQRVMAGPEADFSKLAQATDTMYEIYRDHLDVFVNQIDIKPAARALLTSDMPSEHPELVERQAALFAA